MSSISYQVHILFITDFVGDEITIKKVSFIFAYTGTNDLEFVMENYLVNSTNEVQMFFLVFLSTLHLTHYLQ